MNAARQLRVSLVVWIVLGCGIVAALHLGKAAIATPSLQADLGVDLAGAGWLTGIFAVLGLLGGAASGAVVAAVGDRRALLLGLGITAVAGVAGATAPSFALLLISRLLEGLGFLLIESQNNGRIDRLFLAIIVLAILGKLSDALIGLLERALLSRWG